MRIRSIKPEFWRSPDVVALDWNTRLVFIGLWSYVDDNGVGVGRTATIAADLFADDLERDSPDTLARISGALQKLSERALVTLYEVDGRRFLYVTGWAKHQRIDKPAKPRYPQPDAENATLATVSRQSRETLAPGTGEQGNRGTGEQQQRAPTSEPRDDVPQRADMNPDAILTSHGMPEAERRNFKTWLTKERSVRSLGPWLTKVHEAGEVPELIATWREATKPAKKIDPTKEWMYLR